MTVQAAVAYAQTKARQGEDFRVRLSTGTTNVDRYVAFTNLAVLNNGTNADILTTNVLNRFLPKDASETLTYDNDGNLSADSRWTYTWDALNRLTGMESRSTAPDASKRKYVFTYDAGGRRIALTESNWVSGNWAFSQTKKFLYNGWDLVAELDGANTVVRSYGWLGKSGGLLWVKDGGEYYVPSFDGNRTVTKLIKWSDRTVAAEYEYAPFGTLVRATGPMAGANPFRFSSEYHDDGTGLVYYGYRYYSPETHRWLSKDPIGYAGGLNLYGFVGNDPVNGVDWLGLDEWGCVEGYNPWEHEDLPGFLDALGEAGHALNDKIDDKFREYGATDSDGFDFDGGLTRMLAETPGAILAAPSDIMAGIDMMQSGGAEGNQGKVVVGFVVSAGAALIIVDMARPTPKLREMDVANFSETTSKGRGVVGDGLTGDHVPSNAALQKYWEDLLERPLRPSEKRWIRDNGHCFVVKDKLHKEASRTYGGRNTPEKIQADANDFTKAISQDIKAYRDALEQAGIPSDVVDQVLVELHLRNRERYGPTIQLPSPID